MQLLSDCYDIVTCALSDMDVPFSPAVGGMFVYCNMSSLLPELTWEGEEALASLIFDQAGIVLTPGQAQRDAEPGRFRICMAWNR